MGAHPARSAALRHALLESIERDQLARALPRGWTPDAIARRKLDVRGLPLWQRLRDAKLEAYVFDLSGLLPVAGAILAYRLEPCRWAKTGRARRRGRGPGLRAARRRCHPDARRGAADT